MLATGAQGRCRLPSSFFSVRAPSLSQIAGWWGCVAVCRGGFSPSKVWARCAVAKHLSKRGPVCACPPSQSAGKKLELWCLTRREETINANCTQLPRCFAHVSNIERESSCAFANCILTVSGEIPEEPVASRKTGSSQQAASARGANQAADRKSGDRRRVREAADSQIH